MSNAQLPKVTVHLDIVIEGGQVTTQVTESSSLTAAIQKWLPKPFSIQFPAGSPANTPVYACAGGFCIQGSGTCPLSGGNLPYRVLAMAYPNPSVALSAPFSGPPAGAAVATPTVSGNWSFQFSTGNPVPGSGYDTISGGPNNSTLIVWYDYGTPSAPKYNNIDTAPYHGLLSSGSPGPIRMTPNPLPRTVTFLGSLEALGQVVLVWDGSHWFAQLPDEMGVTYFLQIGQNYVFMLLGRKDPITVQGAVMSKTPFVWSGEGADLHGRTFRVIVTE